MTDSVAEMREAGQGVQSYCSRRDKDRHLVKGVWL